MTPPVFSIIVPAYKAAQYLGEAVQSVLNQTFTDFEIIVVNDASPDETTQIMLGFNDSRIKYIVHPENRGLPATRNTAIRASTGKYIALLDADDVFHPDKLQEHYNFLNAHPDVGVSYNSRFDFFETMGNIRRIWLAPRDVTFCDFVVGYPFAPSDIVLRREWVFEIGLLHENNNLYGEDLNTNCRLALAGCKFGYVERVLNYRRHYQSRIRKDLDKSLLEVFQNLELIFNDPRCPHEVRDLRDRAYAYNYSVWAYWALVQNETEQGKKFLRQAVQHDPQLLVNNAVSLIYFLIVSCVTDEWGDPAETIKKVFNQLPDEFAISNAQRDWASGYVLLVRGFGDLMWGRDKDGYGFIERALKLGIKVDDAFEGFLVHQLLGYELEFGRKSTLAVIEKLKPYFNLAIRKRGNSLLTSYLVNSALQSYRVGKYKDVSITIWKALVYNPLYLANRGVMSVWLRSIVRTVR